MPTMEKNEKRLGEASYPEYQQSPIPSTTQPINVIISRGSQNPVLWGDLRKTIRHRLPDEIIIPGSVDVAQAYAGPSNPEPKSLAEAQDMLPTASGTSSEEPEGSQEGGTENVVMVDSGAIPEPQQSDHRKDDLSDESVTLGDDETAREIAEKALAAMLEEDQNPQPSTPPRSTQRERTSDTLPNPTDSPPPARFLRSPIWRSLVPVSPPLNGYWTPSTTGEGEKNAPMCPPCRIGKKGRCFGGLPCDRCREKGYSKERCEGSVVFRFSPRTKRGAAERKNTGRKSPAESAGWKRDAFGRFA